VRDAVLLSGSERASAASAKPKAPTREKSEARLRALRSRFSIGDEVPETFKPKELTRQSSTGVAIFGRQLSRGSCRVVDGVELLQDQEPRRFDTVDELRHPKGRARDVCSSESASDSGSPPAALTRTDNCSRQDGVKADGGGAGPFEKLFASGSRLSRGGAAWSHISQDMRANVPLPAASSRGISKGILRPSHELSSHRDSCTETEHFSSSRGSFADNSVKGRTGAVGRGGLTGEIERYRISRVDMDVVDRGDREIDHRMSRADVVGRGLTGEVEMRESYSMSGYV